MSPALRVWNSAARPDSPVELNWLLECVAMTLRVPPDRVRYVINGLIIYVASLT